MTIPSRETITEAREIIERWVEDLERRDGLPQNQKHEGRTIFSTTAFMARRELLGDGGCVVARFDERYLNEAFRAVIGAAIAEDWGT